MKKSLLTQVLMITLLATTSLGLMAGNAGAVPVDLELSLLIDVSSSVNATEFNLQKQGYVDAFNNSALHTALQNGALDKIAVNFVYWSSSGSQQQAVAWTLIDSPATAEAFADAIAATSRPFFGTTAPGSAVNFAIPLFNNNGFEGTRRVIDVSGDGKENSGDDTPDARDAAEAAGFTINAIAIETDESDLQEWFDANLITSDGFSLLATDFESFGDAILDKLVLEVGEEDPDPDPDPNPTTVPEPGTLGLLTFGLGMLKLRRRKV